MTDFILLLLIVHVLADFTFQSEKLARRKEGSLGACLFHLLLVLALHAAVVPLAGTAALPYLLLIVAAHVLLDVGKTALLRRRAPLVRKHAEQTSETAAAAFSAALYLIDQVIHVALIFAFLGLLPAGIQLPDFVDTVWLRWILLILLNMKPANVTFKKIFGAFAPNAEATADTKPGAGAMIGALERILSLLLMVPGQYAAIGLVMTAKSVARYNRIAESQEFAEYYLIGTLFSLFWAVASFLLIAPAG